VLRYSAADVIASLIFLRSDLRRVDP